MSNPLATNPAYLAFMREIGLDDAEAAADLTTATDAIGRQLARRLPQIADEGSRAREQISGSFESRGLYRSGAHEVALARQRAAEGSAAGDVTAAAADQVADLQSQLARHRAANARKAADAALTYATPTFLDLES